MSDFGGALKPWSAGLRYDVAVLGVPFDEKSSYRRGQAAGPTAIRAVSTGKCYNPETELGVDTAEAGVLVDLGDVDTSGDVDKSFGLITAGVRRILADGAKPIVLGGDHSITYPVIQAFGERYPALDILHFDAHPDLYDDLYGDRLSHACPFARILEDGLVRTLVQVGIRTGTEEHRETARKHGVRWVEMKDWRDGLALTFENPLYISFDLDALDPAFAPGVSHHEPGGLSSRQALDVLHALKATVVGCDVVELNPSRDASGITAAAAFKLVQEICGLMMRP